MNHAILIWLDTWYNEYVLYGKNEANNTMFNFYKYILIFIRQIACEFTMHIHIFKH